MLQHAQQYNKQLINFLYGMNENIDWFDFINKNISLPDEKLLNRVKSLIWVDKDLDYETNLQQNGNLFLYYTNLLNKYYPIIHQQDVVVDILDFPKNDEEKSNVDEFISNEIHNKLNVLCRLLSHMNIQFKLTTSIDANSKIVIPTASIMYKQPDELFKSFNGIMVADNYYNIYLNEFEKELNFFKLSVIQLSKNSEISISEILNQSYGFLKLRK